VSHISITYAKLNKNRVAKVTDVLEAENLRRPAKAAVLEAFSECHTL